MEKEKRKYYYRDTKQAGKDFTLAIGDIAFSTVAGKLFYIVKIFPQLSITIIINKNIMLSSISSLRKIAQKMSDRLGIFWVND